MEHLHDVHQSFRLLFEIIRIEGRFEGIPVQQIHRDDVAVLSDKIHNFLDKFLLDGIELIIMLPCRKLLVDGPIVQSHQLPNKRRPASPRCRRHHSPEGQDIVA